MSWPASASSKNVLHRWEHDEKRAWDEAVDAFGIEAELVAASLLSKQAVFRIVAIK